MLRYGLILIAVASAYTTAAAQPARSWYPSYVVQRVSASPPQDERQVALLARARETDPARRFWIAERWISWREWRERGTTHEWADGRTCPALGAAVRDIGNLPPMKFAGAEFQAVIPPSHTPFTTLRGPPGQYPDGKSVGISQTDFDEHGVSGWWRRSEAALKTCWRTTPPIIDGSPISPLLTSQDAADSFGTR